MPAPGPALHVARQEPRPRATRGPSASQQDQARLPQQPTAPAPLPRQDVDEHDLSVSQRLTWANYRRKTRILRFQKTEARNKFGTHRASSVLHPAVTNGSSWTPQHPTSTDHCQGRAGTGGAGRAGPSAAPVRGHPGAAQPRGAFQGMPGPAASSLPVGSPPSAPPGRASQRRAHTHRSPGSRGPRAAPPQPGTPRPPLTLLAAGCRSPGSRGASRPDGGGDFRFSRAPTSSSRTAGRLQVGDGRPHRPAPQAGRFLSLGSWQSSARQTSTGCGFGKALSGILRSRSKFF